ncbi:hypothetical protein HN51_012245 [Arachis hypogaea]
MLFAYLSVVKDVGRNDLATLIDSSQEVAKKSLEKAAECVRCLEEDMAKARKSFFTAPWLRPWWKKLFTLPAVDLRKKAVVGIIASQRTESSLAFLRSPARRLQKVTCL